MSVSRRQSHKEQNLVKMLRYVLGVAPAEFGLLPDSQGWLNIKELLQALHDEEGWRHLRQGMIQDAAIRVASDEFELEDKRIRARKRSYPEPDYGSDPPAHLYLGARRRAWPALSRHGLAAGTDERPVVLATDAETALKIGRRKDNEALLITVQAHQAKEQGAVFPGWGDLFLCDWAPASCLMGPPLSERPPTKKASTKKTPSQPAMPSPEAMPGSFTVMPEDIEKPYKKKGLKKDIKWKNQRRQDRRRNK